MSRRDISALIIAMRPRWRRTDDVRVVDSPMRPPACDAYNCVVVVAVPVDSSASAGASAGATAANPKTPCDRLSEFFGFAD